MNNYHCKNVQNKQNLEEETINLNVKKIIL